MTLRTTQNPWTETSIPHFPIDQANERVPQANSPKFI